MKGEKIKQINNLIIRHTDIYGYAVWTKEGKCLEDRLNLQQAEEYCRENGEKRNTKGKKQDVER